MFLYIYFITPETGFKFFNSKCFYKFKIAKLNRSCRQLFIFKNIFCKHGKNYFLIP